MKIAILALTAALSISAAAQTTTGVKAPELTHEQKIKLYDLELQKNEIFSKFQAQFNKEVQPVLDTEEAFIKVVNEQHPGYTLQNVPNSGWKFVEVTKEPAKTDPPKEAPKK